MRAILKYKNVSPNTTGNVAKLRGSLKAVATPQQRNLLSPSYYSLDEVKMQQMRYLDNKCVILITK